MKGKSPYHYVTWILTHDHLFRKYKIPSYQKGHAYLTSLRICYVDDEEPRKCSVGIDLKDVDRFDVQVGIVKTVTS